MSPEIRSFSDLRVYQLSHKLAMDIFWLTSSFPNEEKYSLTDQIRRSSRSVSANIAEGWGKRAFEPVLKRHLVDSMGSLEETKAWLHFSNSCQYINKNDYDQLMCRLNEVGSMLWNLHQNWKTKEIKT
jgi:four helix bundle protein